MSLGKRSCAGIPRLQPIAETVTDMIAEIRIATSFLVFLSISSSSRSFALANLIAVFCGQAQDNTRV